MKPIFKKVTPNKFTGFLFGKKYFTKAYKGMTKMYMHNGVSMKNTRGENIAYQYICVAYLYRGYDNIKYFVNKKLLEEYLNEKMSDDKEVA